MKFNEDSRVKIPTIEQLGMVADEKVKRKIKR